MRFRWQRPSSARSKVVPLLNTIEQCSQRLRKVRSRPIISTKCSSMARVVSNIRRPCSIKRTSTASKSPTKWTKWPRCVSISALRRQSVLISRKMSRWKTFNKRSRRSLRPKSASERPTSWKLRMKIIDSTMRSRSRRRSTVSNSWEKLILFRPHFSPRKTTLWERILGCSKGVNGERSMIRTTIRRMRLWLRTILPIKTWSFSMSSASCSGQARPASSRMSSSKSKETIKSETYVRHISVSKRRRRSASGPSWKNEKQNEMKRQKP